MVIKMALIIQAARCDSRALHQEQAAEQSQCHPGRGLLHHDDDDKVDDEDDGDDDGDMRIVSQSLQNKGEGKVCNITR